MGLVTVATDNFNRANGAVGSNWTATADEGFDLTILSNALKGQGGDSAGFWNADSFANDQYSKCTIVTQDDFSGPLVRASAGDWVVGQYSGTNVQIVWYNGGGYNVLGSTAYTVANGDVMTLMAVGTTYTLLVNNVIKVVATSASPPSSGAAGINVSSTDVVDDWEGGNVELTSAWLKA